MTGDQAFLLSPRKTYSCWRKGDQCQQAFFKGDLEVLEWGQLGASLLGFKSQLYPFLEGCTQGPSLRRAHIWFNALSLLFCNY